jgi:hypothetical protein
MAGDAEGPCWFCRKKPPDPRAAAAVSLHQGWWDTKGVAVSVPRCPRCSKFHRRFFGLSSKKVWAFGLIAGFFALLRVVDAVQDAIATEEDKILAALRSARDTSMEPLGWLHLFAILLLFGVFVAAVIRLVEELWPSRTLGLSASVDYPPVRATLQEGWRLAGKLSPAEPSVNQMVDRLVAFYMDRAARDYAPSDTDLQAVEIREIGKALYRRGSMGLMKSTHASFAARVDARFIESGRSTVRSMTVLQSGSSASDQRLPGNSDLQYVADRMASAAAGIKRNLALMWDGIGEWQSTAAPSASPMVDRLVSLYSERPKGYLKWDTGAAATEIRAIGEELNRQGGMALMRAAHADFAAQSTGSKRNLEHMWDGIGEWQG